MAYNHFTYTPSSVTEDRSIFKFFKQVPQGAQLGWLYPMCQPVFMYPGSTLKIDNLVMEVRSGALIAPLMTELVCDVFAFNIPNRIVWEHWKQFLGATDDVLFDNLTEYEIPNFKYGMQVYSTTAEEGLAAFTTNQENYQWNQCLACHFELPYPVAPVDLIGDNYPEYGYMNISALPFRGYDFLVNEFFLPEYLPERILWSKTDDGYSGDNMIADIGAGKWNHFTGVATPAPGTIPNGDNVSVGGVCYPVSRAHRSLYTSCLPKPSLETLNLLGNLDNVPIGFIGGDDLTTSYKYSSVLPSGSVVKEDEFSSLYMDTGVTGVANQPVLAKINEAVLTVNNYRETILLQNYYDCLNRSGSRYDEIIQNLFHTRTSFAVISIPELIVHKRFTIYRKEVVATAQTNNGGDVVKPVGSQASYIDTVIRDNFFVKSTTEHGYIHMLYCIRPARILMTSGFDPDWTRLNKLDLFYPQFQGMGDVPRYTSEVAYGFQSTDQKKKVLGYQEYSAEDKWQRSSAVGWVDPHTPNCIHGFCITEDLASSSFSLSNYFMSCMNEEVTFSRSLAISDPTTAPQFMIDLRLEGEIIHPMKVYNIPGQGDLL